MADITLSVGVDIRNSYYEMQSGIRNVMRALNTNPPKIILDLNVEGTVDKIRSQMSEISKLIANAGVSSTVGTPAVDASAIQKAASAMAEVSVKTADVKAQTQSANSTFGDTANKLNELNAKLKEIQLTNSTITTAYKGLKNSLGGEAATGQNATDLDLIKQKYIELQAATDALREKKSSATQEDIANIYKLQSEMQNLIGSIRERMSAELDASTASQLSEKDRQAILSKTQDLLNRLRAAERDWTAAKGGKSSSEYKNIQDNAAALESLIQKYDVTAEGAQRLKRELSRIGLEFKSNSGVIRESGEAHKTFGERLGKVATQLGYWFSLTRVIYAAYREIKKMISASIELDDAMTQLKIVTNESSASYEKFGNNIAKVAKKVGSSITDMINSATTYARLGYSLEESSLLAEYTAMLQNVGDIDVKDAQDAITAIVKAYSDEIDINNIESVMDKLVTVGNNFPISVSQIAEGMNNASSALSAAGNTFDQSVALLTAANTTIQDAARASTGLRTIAARIRNTKTELDDLGETMTEASYEELVQMLTDCNVALTTANGEYRSTYDIMYDIAQQWDNMTSMEQAALATAMSGTRQQAVFFSIIEQFQEASGAMDAMSDSAGALDTAYSTYMSGTTAHINQFKAAFEQLSAGVFDSGFLQFFIDAGRVILEFLISIDNIIDKLGGLKTILLAVTSALLIAKGGLIAYKVQLIATAAINKIINFFTSLKNGVAGITNVIPNAIAAWKAYSAGVVSSNTAIQASIPIIGWAALAITGIIMLVNSFTDSTKNSSRSIEELNNELKQLSDDIKNISDDFRSLKETADEIVPRFVELAGGVNKFGENVSLTDDEYNEFLQLNNKIAEMFPELNLGMDTSGNAMLALSYSADTLSASLYDLVEAQRAAAYEEISKKMPETLERITDFEEAYNEEIKKVKQTQKTWEDVYTNIINGIFPDKYNLDEDSSKKYVDIARQLGINGNVVRDYHNNSYTWKIEWDNVDIDIDENRLKQLYDNKIAELDKKIHDYENKVSSKWGTINPIVRSWVNTDYMFNELDSNMQLVAETIISGLDFSKLGLTTEEQVHEYITNNILDPLFSSGPEVKEAFRSITDWRDQLNSGKLTFEEFSSNVKSAFDNLISSMDEDSVSDFTSMFINGFKSIGIVGSSFDSVVQGIIESWGKLTTLGDSDPIQRTLSGSISSIEKLSDGLNQLDKIYADVLNGGDFDYSSLVSEDFVNKFRDCGEAYTSFIEQIANSPNDIKACQSAFDDLVTSYITSSGVLNDVTDSTRDVAVAMLEQMGIANAAAIVDRQLAYNKEYLKYTTGEYVDMQYKEIASLFYTHEAGSVAQQALLDLAQQKLITNRTELVTSGDIKQLVALMNTANATAESIKNVANAEALISRAEILDNQARSIAKSGGSLNSYEYTLKQAESLRKQAEELYSKPITYNKYNAKDFMASLSANYNGGSASDSARKAAEKAASDAKKAADKAAEKEESWFEKQYKLHNHLLNMDAENVEDYLNWLNSAYKRAYDEGIIDLNEFYKYQEEVYKGLQDLFKDYLNDIEHEISMRENFEDENKKIIALYKELISAVEKEIKAARAQGLSDTDDYVQELQKKWASYRDAIEKIENDIKDNAKKAVKELVDIRLDMLKQDIENEKDAIKKRLSYLKDFYQKQKDMLQDIYDEEKYLEEQKEKRKTVADIQAELAQLEYDNSAWAQKRKLELAEELADAQKDLNDFERDHALETAQDELDKLYELQEKELEAQEELLDAKLKDAKALYEQALEDIKSGSVTLYQEMIEWNNTYGDGIEETIKSAWEEAYKALQDYKDLYGSLYEDINLQNATGYTKPKESWDNASVSGTNKANQTTSSASKTTSNSTSTNSSTNSSAAKTSAPSLAKGSYVQVKSGTKWYGDSYGGGKWGVAHAGTIKYVNTSGSHPYNIDGLGWVKKTDIVGYASGTKRATPGLHRIDELGTETIFESSDGSRYKMFSGVEKVLNAKASNFLYDFANNGGEIIKGLIGKMLGNYAPDNVRSPVYQNDIRMGDINVHGNADMQTVSEIRRAQREAVTEMLKSFNKLNK